MRTLKTIVAAGMLLGATSVMAQGTSPFGPNHTQTKTSGGDFIFKIPEAFDIECDDTHGTIDAQASKDVSPMIVSTKEDLPGAEAYISCRATSTLSKWTLKLTATNGGKMLEKDTEEALQLTDNTDTHDGVLGMGVVFMKSFKPDDYGTPLNTITTMGPSGKGTEITVAGVPDPDVYGIVESYPGAVNLAGAFETGATRFGAWDSNGKGASTGFEFEIHAAFVDTGDADISSPTGVYKEHIDISLETSM